MSVSIIKYENADFSRHKSVLDTSVRRRQNRYKITQREELFVQSFFKNMLKQIKKNTRFNLPFTLIFRDR